MLYNRTGHTSSLMPFHLLPNRTSVKKGPEASCTIDSNRSNLDITTMVSSSATNGHTGPVDTSDISQPSNESMGRNSPLTNKRYSKTGGVAYLRKGLTTKGISDTAVALITQARSKGTRLNYETSWRKLSGWCNKRKIDPFSCPLNDILDYLGSLFDEKCEYRTINNHRSAISAFHELIDGVTAGKHPLVKSLMKGVSKERQPLPKYCFIWDVEMVINKICSMPTNTDMSIKLLSFKTVTLLGLTAINRSSEMVALNTKLMCNSKTCYKFAFGITVKHSKQGKPVPIIEFFAFNENDLLCPVKCLDAYIQKTSSWRIENDTNQLFLSYMKPHKSVLKCTITRWVKEMLKLSGINIGRYQAHSVRSASSSKAACKGLTTADIHLFFL